MKVEHQRTSIWDVLVRFAGGWWPIALSALVVAGAACVPRDKRFDRPDLLTYYVPQADRIGRQLAMGYAPWWNPEVACGVDCFSVMQTALCYPPTWVHALLGVRDAMVVLVLLHLLVAGTGMSRWLRCLGTGRDAAVLASTVFLFGLIGEASWPPMFYTISWAPWLLVAIDDDSAVGPRRWSTAVLALSMQLLAGCPQQVLYCGMFCGAYCLVKASISRSLRLVSGGLSAAGMAGLIASVQLVPSYLYIQETWRLGTLSPEEVHYLNEFSEAPKSLGHDCLEMAKQLLRHFSYSTRGWPQALSFRDTFGYLGGLMPVTVGVALARRLDWRRGFCLAAVVAGWYLAMGYLAWLPAYDLLARAVPLFGSLRTPDRLLVWSLLGMTALTGFGADTIWHGERGTAVSRWTLVAVLGICIAISAAVAFAHHEPMSLVRSAGLICVTFVLPLGHRSALGKLVIASVRPATVAYLCLLTDIELASGYVGQFVHGPGRSTRGIQVHRETLLSSHELASIAQQADHDRIYIGERYEPVMRTTSLPPFRTLPFYEPLVLRRQFELGERLWAAHDSGRTMTYYGYWGLTGRPHLRLLDACSVRMLVTRTPIVDAERFGWKVLGSAGKRYMLYQNLRCIPRASLFAGFEVVSEAQALEWLLSCGTSKGPEMPRLEDFPSQEWLAERSLYSADEGLASGDTVEWLADEPNHIVLRVVAARPMILLLTDTWARGWHCRVNGRAQRVLRANYLHRAVELTVGENMIEFQYWPRGVLPGLGLTVIGLAVFVGVLAVSSRTRAADSKAVVD